MTKLENLKAVNELLKTNSTENFINDLTEMWEAWITSDLTDCTTATDRAHMLMSYKTLYKFLSSINEMEMFDDSISEKELLYDLKIAENQKTIEKIKQHHG